MFELSKEQFQCVQALLPPSGNFIEPKAVIDLNNPGWVFADSLTRPKAAMVWSQGNYGFYLLGKYTAQHAIALNRLIDTTIIPRLVSKKIDDFEFSGVPPITDEDLESIFKSRSLSSWKQTVFKYNNGHSVPDIIPQQGKLCDIKEVLTENPAFVNEVILNYWESLGAFYAKADGYCVLVDNVIASWAITGWIAGNIHEITIETVDIHRQKGYAKACASALINCYLKKGYIPHWECETANTPSAKLAEGFGFVKSNEYMCYGLKF